MIVLMTFFTQALKIDNRDIKSLHQLGVVFYYKRNNKSAIDIYNKILAIEPADEQALYKRGLAKVQMQSDFEGGDQKTSRLPAR